MKILIFCLLISQNVFAGYLVKKLGQDVESVVKVNHKVKEITLVKSLQEYISERDETNSKLYQEILYPEKLLPSSYQKFIKIQNKYQNNESEVKYLIKQGPFENRINISILGDGYTLFEKKKFFDDVDRIVKDLFREDTFKSYLPLFNIVAIYVPSNESGISDLITKDTVFSLYRSPKGSKRAIIPGNSIAIERALDSVDFPTHYPIIIANDDYYGGLGGRYAITTRSLNSGSMVLRHELGHNFSNVGEEYDGGQVYSGANFSRTKNVSWKHWLDNNLSVNNAKFLTGAYIWQNLTNNDYIEYFTFNELEKHYFYIEISSVGWESNDDVKVLLDGKILDIEGVYTKDRSFFKTKKVIIEPGMHELKIIDNNKDGNNVLAFANSKAYPIDYKFDQNIVGAFNVFDANQDQRGYRPTHKQCLMRDMRSKVFCPIDQENIWLQFLKQMSLIDEVVDLSQNEFEVKVPNIKNLEIRWYEKSFLSKKEIQKFRNLKKVDLSNFDKGTYLVEVTLNSQEIRKNSSELTDNQVFQYR